MDNTLYMGELVEPLGFDSIWATEHYGSAYSMQPNPLQYLAYWAGRTQPGRCGHGGRRRSVVEPGPAGFRAVHARHPPERPASSSRHRSGHCAPRVCLIGIPHRRIAQVFLRRDQRHQGRRRRGTLRVPGQRVRHPADHHPAPGPSQGRIDASDIKVAFTTEASARMAAENGLGQMFVAGDDVDEMTDKVRRFNRIRKETRPPAGPTHHFVVDVLRRDRGGSRRRAGPTSTTSSRRPSTTTSNGTTLGTRASAATRNT